MTAWIFAEPSSVFSFLELFYCCFLVFLVICFPCSCLPYFANALTWDFQTSYTSLATSFLGQLWHSHSVIPFIFSWADSNVSLPCHLLSSFYSFIYMNTPLRKLLRRYKKEVNFLSFYMSKTCLFHSQSVGSLSWYRIKRLRITSLRITKVLLRCLLASVMLLRNLMLYEFFFLPSFLRREKASKHSVFWLPHHSSPKTLHSGEQRGKTLFSIPFPNG